MENKYKTVKGDWGYSIAEISLAENRVLLERDTILFGVDIEDLREKLQAMLKALEGPIYKRRKIQELAILVKEKERNNND